MIVANSLEEQASIPGTICFSIGVFDGVHLGHQKIFEKMNALGTSVVFTFKNHPFEVLKKAKDFPYLLSYKDKLQLFNNYGIEHCIIQPFTHEISQMTYEHFIREIYKSVPFDHIFLGEGDAIGLNREGTPDKMAALGKKMNFSAHYVPKVKVEGEIVSSSLIRKCLEKGQITLAEKYLGHPYAISTPLARPYLYGKVLKPGKYDVIVEHSEQKEKTVATVDADQNIDLGTILASFEEEQCKITFIGETNV